MQAIVQTCAQWLREGRSVGVATVVATWGSSPCPVGSKLAFTLDYRMVGSVSGGCVEGAVVEAGLETLSTGRPQLLSFGVADETAFEVIGLACGGQIEVFVEPLSLTLCAFWERALARQTPAAAVTIIDGPPTLLGGRLLLDADGEASSLSDAHLRQQLGAAAQDAIRAGASRQVTLTSSGGEALRAFIEVIAPPTTLIIVGAVHIAMALTVLAKALGYRVIVIDPRSAFASQERFPHADQIIVAHPSSALKAESLTPQTAVVVLGHDAKLDDPALQIALNSPAFYVGALGGQKTRQARRERLLKLGLSEAQLDRLCAPIGLPIGARTPEEIAVAILAQIIAARNGKLH